jgi:hypothetical protein
LGEIRGQAGKLGFAATASLLYVPCAIGRQGLVRLWKMYTELVPIPSERGVFITAFSPVIFAEAVRPIPAGVFSWDAQGDGESALVWLPATIRLLSVLAWICAKSSLKIAAFRRHEFSAQLPSNYFFRVLKFLWTKSFICIS